MSGLKACKTDEGLQTRPSMSEDKIGHGAGLHPAHTLTPGALRAQHMSMLPATWSM